MIYKYYDTWEYTQMRQFRWMSVLPENEDCEFFFVVVVVLFRFTEKSVLILTDQQIQKEIR